MSFVVPTKVLDALGIQTGEGPPRRWVGGVLGRCGWLQGLDGVVLNGACVGRHGRLDERLAKVERLLSANTFTGFFALTLDGAGKVLEGTSSLPYGGTLAVLEGVKGDKGAWFDEPSPLLQSWVVSLEVIARGARGVRGVLEPRVMRHFHTARGEGVVGWATSWSDRLVDAVNRAEITAHAVRKVCEGAVWRTGVASEAIRALSVQDSQPASPPPQSGTPPHEGSPGEQPSRSAQGSRGCRGTPESSASAPPFEGAPRA